MQTAPSVIWIIVKEKAWLQYHASWDGSNWRCNTTGVLIEMAKMGRSIWEIGVPGIGTGSGEVRDIFHIYCPSCQSRPKIRYGSPIHENELVEVFNS